MLSWPADAIQPRSLITHPDACSETHTHTHTRVGDAYSTLCRCIHTSAWGVGGGGGREVKRSKRFTQDIIDAGRMHSGSVKRPRLRSHPACDTHSLAQKCRAQTPAGAPERPTDGCSEHLRTHHRVNKATRHAQADATLVRFSQKAAQSFA